MSIVGYFQKFFKGRQESLILNKLKAEFLREKTIIY